MEAMPLPPLNRLSENYSYEFSIELTEMVGSEKRETWNGQISFDVYINVTKPTVQQVFFVHCFRSRRDGVTVAFDLHNTVVQGESVQPWCGRVGRTNQNEEKQQW